jgi:predicted HAD superfamily Cof-like phosphohydrolase
MKPCVESLQMRLLDFHQKYGQYVSPILTTDIPPGVKKLRQKLIIEEYKELLKALKEDNLVDIADAAADLVYVVVGTCIAYGIPFDRIFSEVHNSNMTKTPIKVINQGDKYGTKNPKGPGYMPPEIQKILLFPHDSTSLERKKEPPTRQEVEGSKLLGES